MIRVISLFFIFLCSGACAFSSDAPYHVPGLEEGMSKKKLLKNFSTGSIRSYRYADNEQYITFDYKVNGKLDTLTVYMKDNKVYQWKIDDREEVVKQYLEEFASGNLLGNPKIRAALRNALQGLPKDVFLEITKRSRPIIFIDYYTVGIAKYASSLEFRMREEDPPTFQDGFYMIRLGDALNEAPDAASIQGIVLHEIAHRVLEHLRKENFSCEFEREANRLVKEWGHEEDFLKAVEVFGAKKKGDSPCRDALLHENELNNDVIE